MIRVEGAKEEFARDGKNCQRCGVQSHDGGKVQDRVRKPNRYSACFIVYYPMGGRAFRLTDKSLCRKCRCGSVVVVCVERQSARFESSYSTDILPMSICHVRSPDTFHSRVDAVVEILASIEFDSIQTTTSAFEPRARETRNQNTRLSPLSPTM